MVASGAQFSSKPTDPPAELLDGMLPRFLMKLSQLAGELRSLSLQLQKVMTHASRPPYLPSNSSHIDGLMDGW